MAKKHLNKINKIITQLEALQSEVDSLRDEFQDKFDNMSDSRQENDYGEDLQDIIDSLDTASCDGLDTAIDELRNAMIYFETLHESKPIQNVDIDIDVSVPLAAGLIYCDRKRTKQKNKKLEPPYNPYDNHWESSFDWVDEDNDGYDDREDGFLE